MNTYCEACARRDSCGKKAGSCIALDYSRIGGTEAYLAFKAALLNEVNDLLRYKGLPLADGLWEITGEAVNLAYPIPAGGKVKLLNNSKIYLGCQLEFAELGICYGVVAGTDFILVCSYIVDGSEPELLCYEKR